MMQPTKDLILTELPLTREETTSFGLLLVDDKKSLKVCVVKVLAIGPGRWNKKRSHFKPTVVQPGQLIAFNKSVAKDIKVNGEKYLLVMEDSILGIVN